MPTDLDLIRAMLDPTRTEDECREQTTARPEDKLFGSGALAPDRLDSDPDVIPPAPDLDEEAYWV